MINNLRISNFSRSIVYRNWFQFKCYENICIVQSMRRQSIWISLWRHIMRRMQSKWHFPLFQVNKLKIWSINLPSQFFHFYWFNHTKYSIKLCFFSSSAGILPEKHTEANRISMLAWWQMFGYTFKSESLSILSISKMFSCWNEPWLWVKYVMVFILIFILFSFRIYILSFHHQLIVVFLFRT